MYKPTCTAKSHNHLHPSDLLYTNTLLPHQNSYLQYVKWEMKWDFHFAVAVSVLVDFIYCPLKEHVLSGIQILFAQSTADHFMSAYTATLGLPISSFSNNRIISDADIVMNIYTVPKIFMAYIAVSLQLSPTFKRSMFIIQYILAWQVTWQKTQPTSTCAPTASVMNTDWMVYE